MINQSTTWLVFYYIVRYFQIEPYEMVQLTKTKVEGTYDAIKIIVKLRQISLKQKYVS